jgi:hypothetical protein
MAENHDMLKAASSDATYSGVPCKFGYHNRLSFTSGYREQNHSYTVTYIIDLLQLTELNLDTVKHHSSCDVGCTDTAS